jgi:protein SCO1/2
MKWLLALLVALVSMPALAAVERPEFDPAPGKQIDLGTPLSDDAGATATLKQIIGGRTALILFGYHNCPNQCGVAQQVISTTLMKTGFADKVAPLFITLAPQESPTDAAGAKARLIDAVGDSTASNWRFLSGPDVVELGEEFGIGTLERERIKQYVHPVAVYTLTPEGRISHVLPGLDLTAEELRLALVEASQNKLGTVVDQIALWCAGYDTSTGRYTAPILGYLRVGAVGTVLLGLIGLAILEIRKRHWTV